MRTYRQDSGGHLYPETRSEDSERLGIRYWCRHEDVRKLEQRMDELNLVIAVLVTAGAMAIFFAVT